MDDLLKWVTPDETAAEFLLRQLSEAVPSGLAFIDAHIKLRPGHVLEIVGPAGTSKTEMLIEVAANIMCKAQAAAPAGNPQPEREHVVVIDCDGKFDTLRLLQVAGSRLPPAAVPSQSLDALRAVLERFHLIRCFSSMELLLALTTLPQYLATLQGRCRLLLLDNIAAYTWQDKAATASSSSSYSTFNPSSYPAGSSVSSSAQRIQAAVAALLSQLSQQLRFPVIVTKQTNVSVDERPDGSSLVQKEVMTLPWQDAVTHRLLVTPVVSAGQALAALAQGPRPTEVLMQWQAPGCMGPLERCAVGASAILRR